MFKKPTEENSSPFSEKNSELVVTGGEGRCCGGKGDEARIRRNKVGSKKKQQVKSSWSSEEDKMKEVDKIK